MNFKEGDIVKCVQPLSLVQPEFNLSAEDIYEVSYSSERIVLLVGHKLGYDKSRFVYANDIKDTGVDFF